jgi:carbamoyl-phosphate synthase small subunit
MTLNFIPQAVPPPIPYAPLRRPVRPAPLYARIALADGTVMDGKGAGVSGLVSGELVFQTGMVGYQEALTDPSYAGQILLFTYPLIGNYGVRETVSEGRVHARAAVMQELMAAAGSLAGSEQFASFLGAEQVPTISGVDTRALVRRIRAQGVMGAAVSVAAHQMTLPTPLELLALARRPQPGSDLVTGATCAATMWYPPRQPDAPTVALLDLGAKRSMVERLRQSGMGVWALPATTTAAQILALRPAGVLLSNGPGDPAALDYAVATVRELTAARLPIMGICLGHQVLARALGAHTFKMSHGHRGINQPVLEIASGRVLITTQNHGYSVEPTSLPTAVVITHTNLNDGTVEGIAHRLLPVFSVQWHPEAHPGPADSDALFDRFLDTVREEAASAA